MLVLLYTVNKINKILAILQSFLKTTSFGSVAEVFLNADKFENSESPKKSSKN